MYNSNIIKIAKVKDKYAEVSEYRIYFNKYEEYTTILSFKVIEAKYEKVECPK